MKQEEAEEGEGGKDDDEETTAATRSHPLFSSPQPLAFGLQLVPLHCASFSTHSPHSFSNNVNRFLSIAKARARKAKV